MSRYYEPKIGEAKYEVVQRYPGVAGYYKTEEIHIKTFDSFLEAFDYCERYGWEGARGSRDWVRLIYEISGNGKRLAWDRDERLKENRK